MPLSLEIKSYPKRSRSFSFAENTSLSCNECGLSGHALQMRASFSLTKRHWSYV